MAVIATLTVWAPGPLLAQEAPATPEPATADEASQGNGGASIVKFLGGAVVGLAGHEAGHLLFVAIFDAHPGVKRVSFGRLPFFAITHEAGLSPRREFTIASAGFWVQHSTSELVLSAQPRLRTRRSPVLKGLLAFNIVASGAYSVAAIARAGPAERDTRGMAGALGAAEPWVGALILAPAVLDGWRYLRPDARWPRWISRAMKAGLVIVVIAARA